MMIGGLACLMLLGALFNHWLDRVSNPWAYADPALMRGWQGEGEAGGTRMRLALVLTRDPVDWLPQGDNNTDSGRGFTGKAMFCDDKGRARSYDVRGVVREKHGHDAKLEFSALPGETPGLRPTTMDLHWEGGDEANGATQLAHVLPQGGTRISSSDPQTGRPVLFAFRPGDGSACVPPR